MSIRSAISERIFGFRNGRGRAWADLATTHRERLGGSMVLVFAGWALTGILVSLTKGSPSPSMAVCLEAVISIVLIVPPLIFLWELVIYLHVQGMALDRPAVEKLLLDEQSLTREMAEWLVARQRVIRAMIRAAVWVGFWFVGVVAGLYLGMIGGLLILACAPGILWCSVLLMARVVGFFWVTIGLRRGEGGRASGCGGTLE